MRPRKPPESLFGHRLREARLRADIPQDKLGVLIGIDETVASVRISRYETGVHEPSFDLVERLAGALDVPTAYFFCGDNSLAEILLIWNQLPAAAKKRVGEFVESEGFQHRKRTKSK